jgi:hypothetical protein
MATIALPQPEGKTTQELNREVADQKKKNRTAIQSSESD